MANLTRIKIAKPDILRFFEESDTRIFSKQDMREILNRQRKFWRLAQSTRVEDFVKFLQDEGKLEAVKFEFPRTVIQRYYWGSVHEMEIIQSLKPNSFFSHYTAIYYAELTEQIPKTIYLNSEQSPPPNRSKHLTQTGINLAFARKPRVSKSVAVLKDKHVCLLESMGTENLGVREKKGPEGETVRVTNLERTLIDATVRPMYTGGVFEVLKAYRLAQPRVSINKLVAMLKKMDYIYPYHQAVGYYLERSGVYRPAQIQMLERIPIHFDFHLTYNMKDPEYNSRWKLFIPKGM